jgi:hypothetical protein
MATHPPPVHLLHLLILHTRFLLHGHQRR